MPESRLGFPVGGRVVRLEESVPAVVAVAVAGRRQRLAGAGLPIGKARFLQLTRGCIGAQLIAFVCGLVGADYVESAYFGLILPALSGLACGWVLSRAAPLITRKLLTPVAMAYGGASAAFAFVYASTPYGAVGTWLPPVLCGLAGALAWPYVDPNPR